MSSLYFGVEPLENSDDNLIIGMFNPTAISEIIESSLSVDDSESIIDAPFLLISSTISYVSVSVPISLILSTTALVY